MTIKVLDQQTAEQIAAGEVIENPASVVKELVENALDAGAKLIEIAIQEGGRKSITVTDDGCGIPAAELPLAFMRFATSKLETLSDLQSIESLGFRGEALPSIAAVARVNLTTRPGETAAAARISVAGGKVLALEEVGAPAGTRVEVLDLFYNTPGRLKFLRAAPVESARVTALVTEMALAHPQVAFVLSSEKKTVLQTSGDGELLHVIGALYGADSAAAMLPLKDVSTQPWLSVSGYISAPHLNRASRRQITLIVNGRIIRSSALVSALERGYGTFLPGRRHPVAVLHLQVQPAFLDVNVHPSKTEVRFQQTEAVKELVYQAVKATLQRPAPSPRLRLRDSDAKESQPALWREGVRRYLLEEISAPAVPGALAGPTHGETAAAAARTLVPPDPVAREQGPSQAQGDCRLIGQFLHSYLLVQKGDQLLIIDQHAAHERVIYEALSRQPEGANRGVQLSLPLTVEVPPSWQERMAELLPLLNENGFKMEPFGDNSYIIRAYPFEARGGYTAVDFYALLEEMVQAERAPAEGLREQVRKTVACHRAIKAHQPLSRQEMEQLLEDWEKIGAAPYCPHGRPAVITISREELDRGFKRKGGGANGRS
ncbi:MAG TPA: DNA mismatch repair endonuclease MutL [Bacillota bacterium]|nr:DNA mismatch repair endonuclease MutL [Bacillota bacterium]